jgi:transcription termination/antitermination protein NusG
MISMTNNDISKQILDNELRWYALSVNANQEEVVVENLNERIKKMNLKEDIVDHMLPIVQEMVSKNGKKSLKPRKIYPWYLFVKAKMNDKIWYVIRNTPGVRLIIGAETHPVPLTEAEYQNIVRQVDEKNSKIAAHTNLKTGDVVILNESDFKGMKWAIREVDELRSQVIVMVDFMGRATPVQVSFDMVELA